MLPPYAQPGLLMGYKAGIISDWPLDRLVNSGQALELSVAYEATIYGVRKLAFSIFGVFSARKHKTTKLLLLK
jgi:hypothetical protein